MELTALRSDQILKILEVTDSFNLHREAIMIPLSTKETGSVNLLADGRLKITCPSGQPFDIWLNDLRARLQKTDLSKIKSSHP